MARTAAEDGALSWTGNNTVPVLEKFHTGISEGKAILFIYLFLRSRETERQSSHLFCAPQMSPTPLPAGAGTGQQELSPGLLHTPAVLRHLPEQEMGINPSPLGVGHRHRAQHLQYWAMRLHPWGWPQHRCTTAGSSCYWK